MRSFMIHLGYDTYIRADRIYGVEPLPREHRRPGARSRVWVEGIEHPVTGSRSARAILNELGVLRPRTIQALDQLGTPS